MAKLMIKEEYITVKEAARILKVSERTVSNYRLEGKIPAFQFSDRKFLFMVKDLEEFLKKSYSQR